MVACQPCKPLVQPIPCCCTCWLHIPSKEISWMERYLLFIGCPWMVLCVCGPWNFFSSSKNWFGGAPPPHPPGLAKHQTFYMIFLWNLPFLLIAEKDKENPYFKYREWGVKKMWSFSTFRQFLTLDRSPYRKLPVRNIIEKSAWGCFRLATHQFLSLRRVSPNFSWISWGFIAGIKDEVYYCCRVLSGNFTSGQQSQTSHVK